MPGCLSGSERLCYNNKQPQPLSDLTQQTVSFLFTPKGHLELVWDCLSCPHSRTQADGVATIWRVAGFCDRGGKIVVNYGLNFNTISTQKCTYPFCTYHGGTMILYIYLKGKVVPVSLFSESTAGLGSTGPESCRGTSGDVL